MSDNIVNELTQFDALLSTIAITERTANKESIFLC